MTDLRQVLDEGVGTYRPASDEATVQHRARRRQRTRRVAAGVVAMAIVTVPGWLAWSAFGPAPADYPATEAPPSTYVLDDFEVAPHVDPLTGEVSATEVDVKFDSRWSTEEFPGVHDCTLHVRDTAGVEIGSLAFELEVDQQATRTHEGIGPIPVTGPIGGASADGSCSTERLDTPIAYEISDVQIGAALTITYVVGWPDTLAEGEYPGLNACTAALWDGEALSAVHRFTLSVSEGTQETAFKREPDGSPTIATVTCMPFVREGVFPDPLPPTGSSPDSPVETQPHSFPLGFSAYLPGDWHALQFEGTGRISVQGVAFSNEPLRAGPYGVYPDLSDLFPDGAALIVSHSEDGPLPDYLTDDSVFPLRWEDFQAIPGGRVVGSTLDFRANGTDFTLDLAVRADAPEDLVRTLQAIVASIEPLPLTEGERLPSGYVVVDASRVEQARSTAVLSLDDGPFMLIHAPGGYYALDLPSDVPPSSEFIWEGATQEFVWMQDGAEFARYDRAGVPVLVPPGVRLASLQIHPVIRAWDGEHLLLHPRVSFAALPANMWEQAD